MQMAHPLTANRTNPCQRRDLSLKRALQSPAPRVLTDKEDDHDSPNPTACTWPQRPAQAAHRATQGHCQRRLTRKKTPTQASASAFQVSGRSCERACPRWHQHGASACAAPASLASPTPTANLWERACPRWHQHGVSACAAPASLASQLLQQSVGAGLPAMASAGCQCVRGACIVGKPTPTAICGSGLARDAPGRRWAYQNAGSTAPWYFFSMNAFTSGLVRALASFWIAALSLLSGRATRKFT